MPAGARCRRRREPREQSGVASPQLTRACRPRSLVAQGYYCGFPIGRASPPDPCTKPYNPWLSAAAAGDDAKASQKRPAYGCHLHHQLRLENIARYGVKDDWVAFSQWHDPRERLK